jgi:hypothetical protein
MMKVCNTCRLLVDMYHCATVDTGYILVYKMFKPVNGIYSGINFYGINQGLKLSEDALDLHK